MATCHGLVVANTAMLPIAIPNSSCSLLRRGCGSAIIQLVCQQSIGMIRPLGMPSGNEPTHKPGGSPRRAALNGGDCIVGCHTLVSS